MATTIGSRKSTPSHEECLSRIEYEQNLRVNDEAIRREFGKTNNRIERLAEDTAMQFSNTAMQFLNLNARLSNLRLSRLHQTIRAIQIFKITSSSEQPWKIVSPEGFPMKISTFLGIENNIPLLIRLCKFYNIQWGSWDISFDMTSPQTIEEAVQIYPALAQRDLADELGLDLDNLDLMKIRLEEFERDSTDILPWQRKRSQHSYDGDSDVKRQKAQSPGSQQSSTSNADKTSGRPNAIKRSSPPRLVQRVSTKDLLNPTLSLRSSSSKDTSKYTRLGWEHNSAEMDAIRKSPQDPKRGPQSPSSSKSGSTVLIKAISMSSAQE